MCGVPTSWDPNTTATTLPFEISLAVWSLCNRFIVIAWGDTMRIDILDLVALQQLRTFESPWGIQSKCLKCVRIVSRPRDLWGRLHKTLQGYSLYWDTGEDKDAWLGLSRKEDLERSRNRGINQVLVTIAHSSSGRWSKLITKLRGRQN